MSKPHKSSKPKQLLVEGKNDQHVIWALCKQYHLPEVFSVESPDAKTDGIEALLDGLPAKLKERDLETLGIVVDADLNLAARWQSVTQKLKDSGYQNLPKLPPAEGWVYEQSELPKIGVWVMPDNQVNGILEDFVARLIPDGDRLHSKAQYILTQIEAENLHCYPLVSRPKALIHTWLAWQEKPGMPMGQAITAKTLTYESAIAHLFVAWLNALFNLQLLG